MRRCDHCGGSGRYNWRKCAVCDGKGKVEHAEPHDLQVLGCKKLWVALIRDAVGEWRCKQSIPAMAFLKDELTIKAMDALGISREAFNEAIGDI